MRTDVNVIQQAQDLANRLRSEPTPLTNEAAGVIQSLIAERSGLLDRLMRERQQNEHMLATIAKLYRDVRGEQAMLMLEREGEREAQ